MWWALRRVWVVKSSAECAGQNQAVRKATCFSKITRRITDSFWQRPQAGIGPLVDRQMHKARALCQRLDRFLPNTLPPRKTSMKPELKLTTLEAQREGVWPHQSRGTPSLLLQGHRGFFRTCYQSQYFSRRPCYAGVPVFSLLDTSKWYSSRNFREAEIRHMAPGSEAIVYLSSAPNQRFRGKVQGIGWAVKPEGRDRSAAFRRALRETRTELGAGRATISGSHRSRKSGCRSFPHGRIGGCDHQRSAAEIIL